MKVLRIGGFQMYLTNWFRWVGFRWQNYDRHYGDSQKRWCGFRVYYGFGALNVDF